MSGPIILMDKTWTEICWFRDLVNKMSFPYPGTLLMRENHRYGVASVLERLNKRMDIW